MTTNHMKVGVDLTLMWDVRFSWLTSVLKMVAVCSPKTDLPTSSHSVTTQKTNFDSCISVLNIVQLMDNTVQYSWSNHVEEMFTNEDFKW
jgi:hypothetical protein